MTISSCKFGQVGTIYSRAHKTWTRTGGEEEGNDHDNEVTQERRKKWSQVLG